MNQPRTWTLKSEPGRIAVTVPFDTDVIRMGESVRCIELEPVLDLLERVAPKLSYAPGQLVRAGQQPKPKERWLRDEIEALLSEHGRLRDESLNTAEMPEQAAGGVG